VGGQQLTQPLTLRMDPRVTTPQADLARVASLSREMYDDAVAADAAYEAARALVARLGGAGDAALRGEVEALAPAPRTGGGGFFGGTPAGPPTLNGTSQALISAAMAMQEADVAPTARQVEACAAARSQFEDVMAQWRALEARASGD
jgi:hypothetical protein